MFLSEAFHIAFRIAESSTEDLRLAQATIEFAQGDTLSANFELVKKQAISALGEEIAERRARLKQSLSMVRRLAKKQEANTTTFTEGTPNAGQEPQP